MIKSISLFFPTALLLAFLGGCQYLGGSFEAAADLDRSGKNAEAIKAYRDYLQHHPTSALAPRVCYRVAQNYETQSDYAEAIQWYQKVVQEFPGTDEELHSLLDLASLYRDKLKDPAQAMVYNQKAYDRYMGNLQIRDAIQSLIEAQYSSATALFVQKDYKGASEALDNVYKTFPLVFIQADTRAKLDSLSDRARRATEIAKVSVDWIVLKNETPFNKSNEGDFPSVSPTGGVLQSPDGSYLAERKRAANGKYYLYVAQISPKSDDAIFHILSQTIGAELPAWSSDSRCLVYWQTRGKKRKLLKTDVRTKTTQTLFYSQSSDLGIHPACHPAGNKIAYVYAGDVCLVDTDGAGYKQLLKTHEKLDYTADLSWSIDGTMIRCRQAETPPKTTDELLVLDVSAPTSP